MPEKSDNSIEDRRRKARAKRFKKAIVADLNIGSIRNTLWEIQEVAADVRYWCQQGDETMLDELLGDEDEAYEFKMAFSTLCSDCERMLDDINAYENEEYLNEYFDDFFGAIGAGNVFGGMIGYDSFEGDYFGLDTRYEQDHAQEECTERLKRHTKAEIIEAYSTCFRVAVNFISLQSRYENLNDALEILHGENRGFLQLIKRIEGMYEKSIDGTYDECREFDNLINSLPDEVWVQ